MSRGLQCLKQRGITQFQIFLFQQIHAFNEIEALMSIFARAFLETSSKMKRDILKTSSDKQNVQSSNLIMYMDENENMANAMYFVMQMEFFAN